MSAPDRFPAAAGEACVEASLRTAPRGQCPSCGDAHSAFLFAAPDRLHGVPGTFFYRRCVRCGTVFQDPCVVEEDLPRCYPSDYYTHGTPMPQEAEPAHRMLARGRDRLRDALQSVVRGQRPSGFLGLVAAALARFRTMRAKAFYAHKSDVDELLPWRPQMGRALDVGCGSGSTMAWLMRMGWTEVEGLDWDPLAAARARASTGRTVWCGDLQSADLPAAAYDLIVVHHVFEHLAAPLQALQRLASLLARGGRLVMVMPNPQALGARVYGGSWFSWDPPRHLVLPTMTALLRLASGAGLCARIRTSARDAAEVFAVSGAYHRSARTASCPGAVLGLGLATANRLLVLVERALVMLGAPVGEEILASFEPAGPP